MLKNLLLSLVLSLPMIAATLPNNFLERFDVPLPEMRDGTSIAENMGLEKGALEVSGLENSNQIAHVLAFDVNPGEQYAFALVFKNTKGVVGGTFITQAVFYDEKGTKQVAPTTYFKHPSSPARYMHRYGIFDIPENCRHVKLMQRMAGMKNGEKVWIDNLRAGKVGPNGQPKAILLDSFDTTFDAWDLNHHLVFERFCMGNGGKIVNEWKKAKIGEAFFQANGSLEPMQYSLYIDNLCVKPQCNYILEGYYKATDDFQFNGHGILICFQKDKNGKPVHQTRFHIRNTNGEWKPFTHVLTTHPDCCAIDIGLNTRNMKPEEFVCLDHLRFHEGKGDIRLESTITPADKRLDYSCVFIGITPDKLQSAKITLVDGEGKNVLAIDALEKTDGSIDLSTIPDAYYTLQCVAIGKDNAEFKSEAKKIAVCNNVSWANDIGVIKPQDAPPKPWTALKCNGRKIWTWSNELSFGNALLPEAIPGILSCPMSFAVNGKELTAESVPAWQENPSLCKATQALQGGNWKGAVTATVDYSGFMRFRIKLIALDEMTLDSARLAFTLEHMDFLYRSDDSWTEIGAVDLHAVPQWSTKHFYNEIQFGTLDNGLVWYAPKLCPAKENLPKEWIKVDSASKSVAIEMQNEVRQLNAGESAEYEFAIATYPFRPVEKHWQTMRFRGGEYSNLDLIWQSSGMFKYYGSTPEPNAPEKFIELISDKKVRRLIYQFPFYILDTIPEWSYFEKEWKAIPSRAYDFRGGINGGMGMKGDIRKRSWQDFYMSRFRENLNRYKVAGVYYDCFGTDLFQENGESFHPVFETRQFQERIYCEQRRIDPETITITHAGGSEFGTASAFADVILMGEQYRGHFNKHDYYTQFMTLDEFRYENVAEIGPARMLLPPFRRQDQIDGAKTTMHFLGMAILHNLMIYPNFINQGIQLAIRGQLYEFGLKDSVFHPYWKDGCPIIVLNETVKASCHENATGLFVTVMNPTAAEQSFAIKTGDTFRQCMAIDENGAKQVSIADAFILQPYQPLFFRLIK